MSLRAMWKGIVNLGTIEVPVKLYSAVEDRTVHFRLMHRKDLQPVKQKMVRDGSAKEVPKEQMRKGVELDPGRYVLFEEEELEDLEPERSRTISIEHFVPPEILGHQWYDRPYFLGPDGDKDAYWSLHAGLEKSQREGIARWVMRGRDYIGALRAESECLVLITLHFAEQIIAPSANQTSEFREFEMPEIKMARQLVSMMTGEFEPQHYHDEYRSRVLQLIATKKSGGRVSVRKPERKDEVESLSDALKASLAGMKD